MPGSPPLQRHVSTKAELLQKALTLPLELRRELATSLLWSMPRNEVLALNERLNMMLQKDIVGLLPPELAFLILSRLDLGDILKCSSVSRTWRNLCNKQALWALLCATNSPPIRPLPISWAELTTQYSLPPPTDDIEDPTFDISLSDDRLSNHYDVIDGQGGMGGGGGIDPLGMSGGLRWNVWERGGAGSGEGLPVHLQRSAVNVQEFKKKEEPPITSHLAVPSANPQANFKHLYIVHHILEQRMKTPRPIGMANYMPSPPEEVKVNMPSLPPVPRPRTIDAISSIKYGGLPGHSEAVYSLSLISHSMRINMLQACPDCHVQLAPPSNLSGITEGQFRLSVMETLSGAGTSPRRKLPNLSQAGGTRDLVTGRDWLLSGSRDKTLRLWQLSPAPRVVKIFHGGHTGSVLTHAIVKVPCLPFISSPQSRFSKLEIGSSAKEAKERVKVMAVSGGSDGKICLWDVEGGNGEPEKCVKAHEDSVLCVRADDERIVSCSKDKTIRLFSIHTLEPLLVIGGTADLYLHRGAVNAVGLSKDYIISASGDKTLRVWSIKTGALLACIEGHHRGIASIDFSPLPPSPINLPDGQIFRGLIVTGSSDASIRTFHLIEDRIPDLQNLKMGHSMVTSATDGSEDGYSQANTYGIPTELTGEGHKVILVPQGSFFSPCICPPGLSRMEGGVCRRCFNRGHLDLVRTVHFGKGVILSGSYDATVKVWSPTGEIIADLHGAHTGRVFSVVGDRMRIVSSGLDCRINIWDFSEGLDTSFVAP
ncbi:f-box/wd-repeat protein lin-23, putative [Cryptococcus deneoformans JEC21]|uniref:F-box/wd-repeat protein lin-23, putative n=1 Tax=Cryptococcus deneoformans (strain JEC21 / ATCC MYA-565) TaxID=214684 RepID=Q5KP64_CRYD1|nr:f-box/wd-repeat protein lin-23, putative [Cryptococcus neoformans var. neoformans JEC21]AAW40931.2 f-box/wd-repeat protein lin-23, putative [Cryptococcus neoformans var. neoformans JEC21]